METTICILYKGYMGLYGVIDGPTCGLGPLRTYPRTVLLATGVFCFFRSLSRTVAQTREPEFSAPRSPEKQPIQIGVRVAFSLRHLQGLIQELCSIALDFFWRILILAEDWGRCE